MNLNDDLQRVAVRPGIPKEFHRSIPPEAFGGGQRPTLALLINFRDKLLLVNHAKAPEGQWTLPQEGAEHIHTPLMTARQLLTQELGCTENLHYTLRGATTRFFDDDFRNPIPPDRLDGKKSLVKCITFLGVQLRSDRIKIEKSELRAITWVSGWTEFIELTKTHAERRPEKFRAIARVLISACVPKKDSDGRDIENAFFAWGPPPEELVSFLREQVAVSQ